MDDGRQCIHLEYQKISKEKKAGNEDRQLNARQIPYNWYEGVTKKNPSIVDITKAVGGICGEKCKRSKLDATFSDKDRKIKAAF